MKDDEKPLKPMTKRDVEALYLKTVKTPDGKMLLDKAAKDIKASLTGRMTVPLSEGLELEIDLASLARLGSGALQSEESQVRVACWLMDRRSESEHVVTVDSEEDLDVVADNYAAKHCRCQEGDIIFVETERGVIWRVESVSSRPTIVLLTAMCTREEALKEIATLEAAS